MPSLLYSATKTSFTTTQKPKTFAAFCVAVVHKPPLLHLGAEVKCAARRNELLCTRSGTWAGNSGVGDVVEKVRVRLESICTHTNTHTQHSIAHTNSAPLLAGSAAVAFQWGGKWVVSEMWNTALGQSALSEYGYMSCTRRTRKHPSSHVAAAFLSS